MTRGAARPLRVLHCPLDVGGHPSMLATAERAIGLDSRCVTLAPSPFGYGRAESLVPSDAGIARHELARLRLLGIALRWADVVHLNFGSTILPPDTAPTPTPTRVGGLPGAARGAYRLARRLLSGRDLALLRRAGKGVVVTFQGDDVRPTAGHPAELPLDLDQDRRKARLVGQFDRHAHALFALNPDLLAALPARAEFLAYANVDPAGIGVRLPRADGIVRIAHAPTNRSVKGTADVVAAVDRLTAAGLDVQLDLVEGVPNDEALRRLGDADVVVDQLRIGWYGGLAVEAMALGKPVVARLDDADLARVPDDFRAALPIVRTDADRLAGTLTRLAGSPAELVALGQRGRDFVEAWHDPRAVARRLVPCYEAAAGRPGGSEPPRRTAAS